MRGDGYPEKDSQSPRIKVEATLPADVWIRHELGCHHNGAGHPPVHLRITGTCTQYQCAETAMGRRGGIGAVQVRTHHITSPHPHHPTPPLHPIIGTKQREKPKRHKVRRRHRGHPKGGIQATRSPQRQTRQHQGGTGYTCPPLILIEQTHTRIK